MNNGEERVKDLTLGREHHGPPAPESVYVERALEQARQEAGKSFARIDLVTGAVEPVRAREVYELDWTALTAGIRRCWARYVRNRTEPQE